MSTRLAPIGRRFEARLRCRVDFQHPVRRYPTGRRGLLSRLAVPIVPLRTAGAALTAFSTALLGLYARTPGQRKPGSIGPTQQGIAISKDICLLNIGASLLTETTTRSA
jgi:hypothetical protein